MAVLLVLLGTVSLSADQTFFNKRSFPVASYPSIHQLFDLVECSFGFVSVYEYCAWMAWLESAVGVDVFRSGLELQYEYNRMYALVWWEIEFVSQFNNTLLYQKQSTV